MEREKLLKQCHVQTFRSSGPGGQHVNKTESAVRLIHKPTGIVVSCQEQRSQHQNKALALKKLSTKIEKMNRKPNQRIATKVPIHIKEKRLDIKKKQTQKKRDRKISL